MCQQYPTADTPQQPQRVEQVLSAVFFGISTLSLFGSLIVARSAGSLIIGVIVWLVGLAAIILLFRKESAPFFAKPAPR